MLQKGRIAASLDSLAAVAIVIASCAVTWSIIYPRQSGAVSIASADNEAFAEEFAQAEPIDVLKSASAIGAANARVALVEFSDYQCPFCGRHASDTVNTIRKNFVDSGVLRYVFVNLPLEQLHPFAVKAAYAAECAGAEGKFWQMHDRLFTNPKALSDTVISRYAIELDLNKERFNGCVAGPAVATKVENDLAVAARLGITSTPTFVLGEIRDGKIAPVRKIRGAVPYEVFRKNIEELRGGNVDRAGD